MSQSAEHPMGSGGMGLHTAAPRPFKASYEQQFCHSREGGNPWPELAVCKCAACGAERVGHEFPLSRE
jgi:hypothetical protein